MAVGDVTYTDMLDGRVTFTQIQDKTVRMTGQFNEGFDDPTALIHLYVGDLPPLQADQLDLKITPPGTSAFEYDYKDVTIDAFTHVKVRVIADNDVIAVGGPTIQI